MHELPEFKAADLTRHTSDLFDAAIRSPIAITKHRKRKFVLMSKRDVVTLCGEA